MKVTYYGHSCFGVQIAGRTLLFDPFITGNELARGVDAGKIPADYILISHGHADHMADAADIAKRTGATIISNYAAPFTGARRERQLLITPQAGFRRQACPAAFALPCARRTRLGFGPPGKNPARPKRKGSELELATRAAYVTLTQLADSSMLVAVGFQAASH